MELDLYQLLKWVALIAGAMIIARRFAPEPERTTMSRKSDHKISPEPICRAMKSAPRSKPTGKAHEPPTIDGRWIQDQLADLLDRPIGEASDLMRKLRTRPDLLLSMAQIPLDPEEVDDEDMV